MPQSLRHVLDDHRTEVGLAGLGTDRRELGAGHRHELHVGRRKRLGLQHLTCLRGSRAWVADQWRGAFLGEFIARNLAILSASLPVSTSTYDQNAVGPRPSPRPCDECSSPSPQATQAPDLTGLWGATLRFGPDIGGPAHRLSHGDAGVPTSPAYGAGAGNPPSFAFELADGKGSLRTGTGSRGAPQRP